MRGYRIDIWDSTTGDGRSLCRRTARYELNDGRVVVEPSPEEESTVRLAATKSTDKTAIRTCSISTKRWCPGPAGAWPRRRRVARSSRTTRVDKTSTQTEAEVPPGLNFKSRFEAVKGSLPRLRFGRAYWIRARAVDLAGNSLRRRQATSAASSRRRHARRVPALRAGRRRRSSRCSRHPARSRQPAEGESMSRMAIRSFNDTPADNATPTPQIAHRVAAPPQVSVRDAEQHGKLDGGGKVDATLFNLLANQKDLDADESGRSDSRSEDADAGPARCRRRSRPPSRSTKPGRALTYLPDPLAVEVAARVFDHPNIADIGDHPDPALPGRRCGPRRSRSSSRSTTTRRMRRTSTRRRASSACHCQKPCARRSAVDDADDEGAGD